MNEELKYTDFKVAEIQGRYVTNAHIQNFIHQLPASFHLNVLGESVKGIPIYGLKVGTGLKRILMWSQMHGNESTTTKAVLDLINYLKLELGETENILQNFTLQFIPILNPDGAKAYTRVNANGIDLNRDAQNLLQPESRILKSIYEDFKPDYCFNLHDQRTIFNVGRTEKPATVSFLAPAFDEGRNVSETRLKSMQLIAAMNEKLQEHIPGQVGRYDDSFNANCVGDAFQMLQTPTILFEAGHFPNDYQRESTRVYIGIALLEALKTLASDNLEKFTITDYDAILENQKMFYDVIIINVNVLNADLEVGTMAGILFREKLHEDRVLFEPTIEFMEITEKTLFGHEVKDALRVADRLWLENQGIFALFT
ncbi:MAG: hypothetical protein ACJAUQ_001643 [Maribacter sp.]|jgi:hypothetical protein